MGKNKKKNRNRPRPRPVPHTSAPQEPVLEEPAVQEPAVEVPEAQEYVQMDLIQEEAPELEELPQETVAEPEPAVQETNETNQNREEPTMPYLTETGPENVVTLKVVGVGGAGNIVVNRIMENGIVEFTGVLPVMAPDNMLLGEYVHDAIVFVGIRRSQSLIKMAEQIISSERRLLAGFRCFRFLGGF